MDTYNGLHVNLWISPHVLYPNRNARAPYSLTSKIMVEGLDHECVEPPKLVSLIKLSSIDQPNQDINTIA
jgi:hypothetical protein